MFKLSRAAEYAVRGVVYIASKKGGTVVHIREIAKTQKVPESFLVKVFGRLSRHGIVQSVRGNKGGFRLAKSPAKISMLDIITAVEGPVNLNECIVCGNNGKCNVRPVWDEVRDKMVKVLQNTKINSVAS